MARTVEFDREDVLKNAMDTFWEKGYSMTSIPNLVEATSLNPGSIYAAFDSKEGLFVEALKFYGNNSLKNIQGIIKKSSSPLEAIKIILNSIVNKTANMKRGCLVVNTLLEMSSHNNSISKVANEQLNAVEVEILKLVKDAQNTAEIPSTKDASDLAKYIMINIWGLRVLSKTNPDIKQSQRIISQVIETLTN